MSVLSLPYSKAYFLEKGKCHQIASNETLSTIIGGDLLQGYARFLSLSIKVYIFYKGGDIFFARNVRSFIDFHPSFGEFSFNSDTLRAYLDSGFVVAPFTLIQGVYVVPSYTLIDLDGSVLRITNYYPDEADSSASSGFKGNEDFEAFLRNIIADMLSPMHERDQVVCTLSGGADSALLLKILSEMFPREKLSSITCIMTGLESEATKAEAISSFFKVPNRRYLYQNADTAQFVSDYICRFATPVYDSICPVYAAMIKSIREDDHYKSGKNYIVEGQCADSVLLGLPHNFLLQLYRPGFSLLFKIIASLLPSAESKTSSFRRLLYRLHKIATSLSQPSWIHCLLASLDLKGCRQSVYIKHLHEQLSEYYCRYGSIHKAIAHLFMFRIIQVREMQKYESLPRNCEVVMPFADPRFVSKAFSTPDSFLIERTKRKKPVFDLVKQYMPMFFRGQRTTPFYVKYRLANSGGAFNMITPGVEQKVMSEHIRANDPDRELKLMCLNLILALIGKHSDD